MSDPVQPTVEALRWREHDARHDRDQSILEKATTRLERQVADTAAQLAAQVEASRVGLTVLAELHAKNHEREHSAHERIHAVESEQMEKTARAMDKRLEGMNEFRDQLRDQAAQFASTKTVTEMVGRIGEKVDAFAVAANVRADSLEKLITALDKKVDGQERQDEGSRITTGKLYAALAGIATFLGLVVIVVNLLTR